MLIKLNGTVSREEYGVFSYKGDDLHFQILCQRALNFTNVVLAYINHVYWKHNLVKKDTFLGGAPLPSMEKVYIERTKVVNSLSWVHGGDPLCTLHRAEGLYGWVRCMEYIYEIFLSKNLIR